MAEITVNILWLKEFTYGITVFVSGYLCTISKDTNGIEFTVSTFHVVLEQKFIFELHLGPYFPEMNLHNLTGSMGFCKYYIGPIGPNTTSTGPLAASLCCMQPPLPLVPGRWEKGSKCHVPVSSGS